jgi:gamma-glutamyltranspeptidase / glutathione hydrolase / leukotriene-C4 hydrolase
MNIKDAIDARRVHHQLYPEVAQIEDEFDKDTIKLLRNKYKHNINCFAFGGSIIQGIARSENGRIQANCDYRKGGIPAGG